MLTFIKFGGSVITNKQGEEAADLPVISRLAAEVRAALDDLPTLRLVLGHGSGSFGHVYAARYGVHKGIPVDGDWMGFARTAAAALRLNRIVVDALLRAEVPALALQPSASLHSVAHEVTHWQVDTILLALDHGMVPVVHGDVSFDTAQGSAIISTEGLFAYLCLHSAIRPRRIVLVGEAGVYTADPHLNPAAERIPLITEENIASVLHGTGDSRAVDVTGGMRSKIEAMWQLVQHLPELEIHLIGPAPGLLHRALTGNAVGEGTLIKQVEN
ncbi:MAG: isopentenyl phosphate kinase [Chloroflexaceae bacterium]|jgi:isopentenyl phosphate kinase|nr:isopentenyl phosphate kinase [Chloroflexaceae bacterium]